MYTFENNVSELVCIQTKEETITCTAEHMFYVCGRGWIAAKDIKPFDKFTLYNKQTTVVESVEYKDVENGIKVYNLEVEEYHTYLLENSVFLFIINVGAQNGEAIGKSKRV